jgi:vitamin B12 transporter
MRLLSLLGCMLLLTLPMLISTALAQDSATPRVEPDAAPLEDAAQDAELDLGDDSPSDSEVSVGDEQAAGEAEIDLGQASVEGQVVAVAAAPAPAVSAVITAEEIAQSGAESVGELLSRAGGFTVNDTFAGSEVAFQGLPSKFTTVLIDGQRIPGHIFERTDFSQLPVSNIERIEIIRGPQAASYGSDSAGIVVNLITKRGTGTQGSLSLGLGSLGYNRQHLSLNGGDAKQSWLFAVERKLRESYDLNRFAPDTDGDSYRQYDFLGKYQRRIGKDRLTLQVDHFLDNATGRSFAPPDQIRMNETFTRRFQGALGYNMDLGRNRSLELTHNYGTYYHDLHRFYVGYEDTSAVDTGFKDTLQDTHLKYQQYKKNYVFMAGLERNWDKLASDRIGGGGVAQAEQRAGFASLEYFANSRWTLSGALRIDDHDLFGSEISPKFSAQCKLDPQTTLAAAAGRGQRFPSLRERYYEFASPFGYSVLGNPDLKPETAWSYSLDCDRTTQLGYLRAGAFRHDVSNMIVFSQIQDSPQVFQTENVGSARSAGLQLSSERRFQLGCRECSEAYLGAGYDVTWIAQSKDAELGTRLVNSPQWDHRLRLFYGRPAFTTEFLLRNTSTRYFDRENNVQAPAATTLDVTLNGKLGDVEWKLAGLNIFDEKNGKYGPEPGRELRLEYTLRF